ncbi:MULTISPECIES: hypothetical protein [Kitasatospora]|uniref:Uncharacterized protein n=2 Tax=Kitasatospora TaxID=2063 RepID=A0ABT1J7E6_9ACTN|nr:hypothetical protein [Kitasatospora paracochleata]MCP2312641.1 hypothetical protein [Kitasatospora paracochleata]
MPYLQRSVLLRAAAAALALGAAFGAESAVENALARGGAQRVEQNASMCDRVARLAADAHADRSQPAGRPPLGRVVAASRCEHAPR